MPALNPDAFSIPGYDTPDTEEMAGAVVAQSDQAADAAPYKIAPWVWILILGIPGYFIVRGVVED